MSLLEEYKNMNYDDKKKFLALLKKDLSEFENEYKFCDLIDKLNEKNIDIKLYFKLIKYSDEIIKIADIFKELNKKDNDNNG